MAGIDDLRLLAANVYSKVRKSGVDDNDVEAIVATTMNKATMLGSLAEAIQSSNPTPDVMDIIQGNLQGREQREYNRVIQKSSMLLRGVSDVTKGATEILPKRAKVAGLAKTYSTKNFSFHKPVSPASGMSKV